MLARIITASVLIPVVTFAVFAGSQLYLLCLAIAAAFIGATEVYNVRRAGGEYDEARRDSRMTGLLILASFSCLIQVAAWPIPPRWTLTTSQIWDAVGSRQAMVCLILVWSTDTSAFLLGRLLRGPKLVPKISSNKTWAGSLSGLIAAAAAGYFLGAWASISPEKAIGLGIAVGISTQAGDLLGSFYKRRVGVKDFSGLLPGHGGLLDRIDGLLLASPTAFFFLKVFVWS